MINPSSWYGRGLAFSLCLGGPVLAVTAQTTTLTTVAQTTTLTIQGGTASKAISPDLLGIFFEDLNYAADGGLYAELVQNRSFEYQTTEQLAWNSFTGWEISVRGNGRGSVSIETAVPVHPNNPHYVVVENQQPGDGVGLVNAGFDGIPVKAGEQYDFSLLARQLFSGNRWSGGKTLTPCQLLVRLESRDHTLLGSTSLQISGRDWRRLTATITATKDDPGAELAVLTVTRGGVAMDEISLFPHHTFKDRPNGLRADLAQAIADLHPKFMRFPGGCLVHGNGLDNLYRWKNSIGPVEQRHGQPNIWGYHQSLGLGFFEFFQFCEDIGAKPLPVVPAGVCCQNADHQGGTGQRGLPLEAMPAYVQDVLDLVEWANGPADSPWGAKRAAAGHPEPFHLQYLGVGNEEAITPVFKERFQMIYQALKEKHPEITVVGTVGPFPNGEDFDAGWKIARELQVPMVDEHYYQKPEWFLSNLHRYDAYDRTACKVYLGEYASQGNTVFNALAEAAYMTSLERNGDVVRLASYAPLLCKQGHSQWRPDMIYFDNFKLLKSANYYVQQLFGQNGGDRCLPVTPETDNPNLAVSCVQDSASGDLILKLVNVSAEVVPARVNLPADLKVLPDATRIVFAGVPTVNDTFANPLAAVPQSTSCTVASAFNYELAPYSFSLIRMKTR